MSETGGNLSPNGPTHPAVIVKKGVNILLLKVQFKINLIKGVEIIDRGWDFEYIKIVYSQFSERLPENKKLFSGG